MGERPTPVPGVDPLFTDEDAVEILDYLADEHLTCSGCGQPLADSLDPENEWRYHAEVFECFACSAADRHVRKIDNRVGLRTRVWLADG